jgi:hypothetical protein
VAVKSIRMTGPEQREKTNRERRKASTEHSLVQLEFKIRSAVNGEDWASTEAEKFLELAFCVINPGCGTAGWVFIKPTHFLASRVCTNTCSPDILA